MAVVLCAESQVSSGNGGCSVGKGWEDRVAQVIKDKHLKTASGKPKAVSSSYLTSSSTGPKLPQTTWDFSDREQFHSKIYLKILHLDEIYFI